MDTSATQVRFACLLTCSLFASPVEQKVRYQTPRTETKPHNLLLLFLFCDLCPSLSCIRLLGSGHFPFLFWGVVHANSVSSSFRVLCWPLFAPIFFTTGHLFQKGVSWAFGSPCGQTFGPDDKERERGREDGVCPQTVRRLRLSERREFQPQVSPPTRASRDKHPYSRVGLKLSLACWELDRPSASRGRDQLAPHDFGIHNLLATSSCDVQLTRPRPY